MPTIKLRLRIRYTRRSELMRMLVLFFLVVVSLGYLVWNQREVSALDVPPSPDQSLTSSTSMREYYLTKDIYDGGNADGSNGNGAGICAEGFHFASLWEILEPSKLKYNTTLGLTTADSGQGPPTFWGGWVRTGYNGNISNTVGQGNCNAWDSSNNDHWGTWINLPRDWTTGQDIHVWEANIARCSQYSNVWCISDNIIAPIYLPLILK